MSVVLDGLVNSNPSSLGMPVTNHNIGAFEPYGGQGFLLARRFADDGSDVMGIQ
jgi:hypothetical protein